MNKIVFVIIFSLLTFISCEEMNKDSYPIIEKKFKLIQSPRDEVILINFSKENSNEIRVGGHILFYGHNSEFILIEQKNRDNIEMGMDMHFDEQMKKIFDTKFSQFYIFEIKNDSVYGPLDKIEYLEMRKKIAVPNDLKLNKSTLDFYITGQRKDIEYEQPDAEVVDIKNLQGNKVSKIKFPFSLFE